MKCVFMMLFIQLIAALRSSNSLAIASVGSLFGEIMVCVISLIAALRSSSSCLLYGMRYVNK